MELGLRDLNASLALKTEKREREREREQLRAAFADHTAR
jgi:hypothetical protein